jgi:hypothetical protein
VLVLETPDGRLTVEYLGRELAFAPSGRHVSQAHEANSKTLATAVEAVQRRQTPTKPAANHPWRRYGTPLAEPRSAGRAAPGGHFYFGLTRANLSLDI